MITKEAIEKLIAEKIDPATQFVVDLQVTPSNQITVLLDSDTSTSIEDCIAVSRHIESNLDREQEDFELKVSSPGLDQPLKVLRQYRKNIGRHVAVKTEDEQKIEGELKAVDENLITVETRTKERIEGRKAKRWVEHQHQIPFENIKETKVVISFK